MERLSGAPESQPSVISVRKSARLCAARGDSIRSIAPEQRGRNAPGLEGSGTGLREGSAPAGLSCVCAKGKGWIVSFWAELCSCIHSSDPVVQGSAALGLGAPFRVGDLLGLLH